MPWDNSLNPGKGRDFQRMSAETLGRYFGVSFDIDYPLAIGAPPKLHKFDIVASQNGQVRFVGECKNYAWTDSGNVPSAKMAFINEALLYLSLAPESAYRFVVLPQAHHPRRVESLAEYYCRTYAHLLSDVHIAEIAIETGKIRVYDHGTLVNRRGDNS
jgi:hypothetical protein